MLPCRSLPSKACIKFSKPNYFHNNRNETNVASDEVKYSWILNMWNKYIVKYITLSMSEQGLRRALPPEEGLLFSLLSADPLLQRVLSVEGLLCGFSSEERLRRRLPSEEGLRHRLPFGKDFAVTSRLRKNYAVASRMRNFIRRSNSVVGLSTRLIRSCSLQMLDPCLCMLSPSVPINLVLIHAPPSLICKGPGAFGPHFNPD